MACRWLGQGYGVTSHWGRGGLRSAWCLYYLPTASSYYETHMTIKQTPTKTGNVWRPGDGREARQRHGWVAPGGTWSRETSGTPTWPVQ